MLQTMIDDLGGKFTDVEEMCRRSRRKTKDNSTYHIFDERQLKLIIEERKQKQKDYLKKKEIIPHKYRC